MDKNSITGLLLIGAILLAFSIYNQPSDAEKAAFKAKQDSIALIREAAIQEAELAETQQEQTAIAPVYASAEDSLIQDSLQQVQLASSYGRFANATLGENQYFFLENEKMKVKIASKGGRMVTAELKEYKTYDQQELLLFNEDSSNFVMNFYEGSKFLTTEDFYFEAVPSTSGEANQLSMRMYGQNKNQYIAFNYSLAPESYMLDYTVEFVGCEDIIKENASEFKANWKVNALSKEKTVDTERATTTVFFKYLDESVDYLSETSEDEQALEQKFQWVSFKQQYFSAVLICESGFEKTNADIAVVDHKGSEKYTREMALNFTLPLERGANASKPMAFYLGPNHYQTLQSYEMELQEMINLGWPVIRHVSKWIIIPLFNFLDGFNLNYGIIILILTLVIKGILFPLTFKNYKSSAKMKVLKPEIEELNKKMEKENDPMKKQQATMALYKKAGVNPMAGCLPMLLQMPILYAMFRFFPASIELRQESFLWAEDLSSYDSIFDLGFEIPFYGDHISLFTLFMAASTYFYTKTNSSMTSMSGPQAQQMKIMMNFMPIMLLVFFNNYAAGLSYYYFLANMITMTQQFAIKKWFINEEVILAQIEENKKKPVKKSNFQKRLEDMAKQKGVGKSKK